MTLINGDLLPPLSASEIEARDPLVLHAKRKAELKAEAERRERRGRRRLDVAPLTPADVDQRVAADQQAQNQAIGQVVGELRDELESLRAQVAELSKELAFAKGLLTGSSGGRLKFFTVRGQFREGERYDRTDVVTRNGAWYVAKRDDPRGAPGSGDDWQIGPIGKRGERGLPGERGERGARGAAGRDAPRVLDWTVHRTAYCAVAKMSDGTKAMFDLRPLFEQYHSEVLCCVETIVERGVAEMARMKRWR